MHRVWESAARQVLEETGADIMPVDAFRVARACGLSLVPGGGAHGSLAGATLTYPSGARVVRQHRIVAHEVGHWALDYSGEESRDEAGADWVAAALMLPERVFDADLRTLGWDVCALQRKHRHCAASLIAKRIAHRREAVATVIDQGRVTARLVSPEAPRNFARRVGRITEWELDLVDAALTEETTVHGHDLCYAAPVIDGKWRRVIVVCELEQLSLRL